MKKTALFLTLILSVALAGCGKTEDTGATSSSTNIVEPITISNSDDLQAAEEPNTTATNYASSDDWSIFTSWDDDEAYHFSGKETVGHDNREVEYDQSKLLNFEYDCESYIQNDVFNLESFLFDLGFEYKPSENNYHYSTNEYDLSVYELKPVISLCEYSSGLKASLDVSPAYSGKLEKIYGSSYIQYGQAGKYSLAQIKVICSLIDNLRFSQVAILDTPPIAYGLEITDSSDSTLCIDGVHLDISDSDSIILGYPAWIPY